MTQTIPDKPTGDRDSLTIRELDVKLETPTNSELSTFNSKRLDDGTYDPDVITDMVNSRSKSDIQQFWDQWMEVQFNDTLRPVPVFETETVEVNGVDAHIVQTETFGRSNKRVLKRSNRFTNNMLKIGKRICLQHVYSSNKPPKDVCEDIPFNVFSYDVMRLREFIDENEFVWMNGVDDHWMKRTPLGNDSLTGLLYIMYNVDVEEIIPRYIGISQRESSDTTEQGLNWNFENVTQESVFARWGYGSSQHIGELSKAVLTDEYGPDTTEQKYETWADELFYKNTLILSDNVYIKLLPFMDNVHTAEQNMVTLANHLYTNELLNIEYT